MAGSSQTPEEEYWDCGNAPWAIKCRNRPWTFQAGTNPLQWVSLVSSSAPALHHSCVSDTVSRQVALGTLKVPHRTQGSLAQVLSLESVSLLSACLSFSSPWLNLFPVQLFYSVNSSPLVFIPQLYNVADIFSKEGTKSSCFIGKEIPWLLLKISSQQPPLTKLILAGAAVME